ncbi:unnamed protein product [Symbiodinium natans]|uniref:Uncharacterized protein n=1 Tax=Symbiodinium natans TaxID=878477 RepID=A0A812M7C8_9DINO|nr:unnamed protein product [Symbiodinium natans]
MACQFLLNLVELTLVAVGTLVTLSPFAVGGLVFMALGGWGTYIVHAAVLDFRTFAYDESCDLRSGDAFDVTAPSIVHYDGGFWETLTGLTGCLMLSQVAALGFSIALAPKFPIPNRSVWENGEAQNLGIEGLTLRDWDACREAIVRAVDLFRPGALLQPTALDKYIYDDVDQCGECSHTQCKEAWKSQTGQNLDEQSVQSMHKVFAYMRLAVRARQKLVLNVQLAHALFMLQLFSTSVQSLQHAYRSNRLFWFQVDTYSFSDAVLLAAYPTRLFTTIVMYSRVVISMSAVNNFFREVSVMAGGFTGFAAQGIVIFYLAMTPPDFVAVLLFCLCHSSFDNIYRICCKPKRPWKGVCFVIVSISTLWLIPLLVHSLSRWVFASSTRAHTANLRLCDMERVLLWDVQGYDMSDLTLHVFSSLDQNMAGLLVVIATAVVAASIAGAVRKCRGHGGGGWTATLGICPGTLLKVWALQPEYYATGFHFNDKAEAVASILGTTWWWHTVGLFSAKYEKQYQHAEKTFYARRRLLNRVGRRYVFSKDIKIYGKRNNVSIRSCREAALTAGSLPCPTCQGELESERLPDTSLLAQRTPCSLCTSPLLLPEHMIPEPMVWLCTSDGCMLRLCHMCMHQITSGDMMWTFTELKRIEALPDSTSLPSLPESIVQGAQSPEADPEGVAYGSFEDLQNLANPKNSSKPETANTSPKKPRAAKRIVKRKRQRRPQGEIEVEVSQVSPRTSARVGVL